MRETRHLWVGNLPDNVREEKVLDHFKRYGKVEKIKLLEKQGSICSACIAFVDIKSALKAMSSTNTINEQVLKTDFFDPSTTSKSPHTTDGQQRSQQNTAPKSKPRKHASNTDSVDEKSEIKERTNEKSVGENIQDNSPNSLKAENYRSKKRKGIGVKKKSKKKMIDVNKPKKDKLIDRGRSPNRLKKITDPDSAIDKKAVAEEEMSVSSRSDSTRSSSRSLRSSSTSSSASTSSTNSTASSGSISSNATADGPKRKVVAMCIRKLPTRPTVSSLRDGIFHEFKRYGKVRSVLIKGEGSDRYALVIFRNTSDANKAINHAKTKLLFGAAIEASIYEGEVSGQELEECGGIIDEFHPRASRTLFVGNLDKTVGYSDIQNIFVRFGHIVAIEIKKQNSIPQYAFLQYTDISSVVRAISKMDGEKLGRNHLKLGFGKTVISSCLWVSGVTDSFTEHYLASCFQRYGSVKQVVIDRNRGMALVFYSQFEHAQLAMSEMKSRKLNRSRLKMDYASNELIDLFIKSMQKSGQSIPNLESIRHLLLPANSPGIPSSSTTGNPSSLTPTPNHHYSRGPQPSESSRSYYDDYSHQNYADSPGASYGESSSRRGSSYNRPWQGRERSRDRYSGYPPDPLHRRRPYDDPPYDRTEREYYRGDHPPPGWEYDSFPESRSKGHPPHYDQDYRHQDYDARRDHDRMYGRLPIGGPNYDDAYYSKRERGRDMERSKDRMRERDRDRDVYYSRSSHASPSLRHVHHSRSQSPSSSRGKSRELDRTSAERNFVESSDANYRKGSSRGLSPDVQTKKRKPSGESRSSTTSGNKLPAQDVDMRETTASREPDRTLVPTRSGDRRLDYREKRKGHAKSQRSPETNRDHRSEYKSQRKGNYDMDMRKSGSLKDNDSEGSPYYQSYPQSRSRSETPTRDENLDTIGEVIIKQPVTKTRYDEPVPSPGKPLKREYSRRDESGGDKDYRADYGSLSKGYADNKNADKAKTFSKDLDYRKGLSKVKSLNSPLRKKDSCGDDTNHHEKVKSKAASLPKHYISPTSVHECVTLDRESNIDANVFSKKSAKKRRMSTEEREHTKKKERKISESKIFVKHEAPMSVAQQIFMQEEEGSEDTQSPDILPQQPIREEPECDNLKKDNETIKPLSSLDITGFDAMFLPNKRLLPVKAVVPIKAKPPDNNNESAGNTKTVPPPSTANGQKSAGNLLQLEKEKLRLQKLLSKLDSDSLDKDEAGEIANVVLDKIVKSTKEKRLKKEAKIKTIGLTTTSPVFSSQNDNIEEVLQIKEPFPGVKVEEMAEDASYEVEEVEVTPGDIPSPQIQNLVKENTEITEVMATEVKDTDTEMVQNAGIKEINVAKIELNTTLEAQTDITENTMMTRDAKNDDAVTLLSETSNIKNMTLSQEHSYKETPVVAVPEKDVSTITNTSEIKAWLTPVNETDGTKLKNANCSNEDNAPVVSVATNQNSNKITVTTTTPSPLSSSSTNSSKSLHKVPYSVHPKQSDHHMQQRKLPPKKSLISPSSKQHQDYHRSKHHHNDPRKRKPSSSSQHKKPLPQSNKKPPYKPAVVPYVEKSFKITVGLDKSPNKPLTKKELNRLRTELESLKRHLSLDSVETDSPCSIEEESSSMSSASPLLYSPIETKENSIYKRSDSNQSSNFMVPTVSNTDRLKQFGRIKKKTKTGEGLGSNSSVTLDKKEVERVKQELHNQRACDFRESRLLRSCIFEQDLERLELLQREMQLDNVKEMLNCWHVNGTSDTMLFAGSRFLEPLPDNIVTNGQLAPVKMETPVNLAFDVNSVNGQNNSSPQSLNEVGPKNVCSLSISDLPASAESQNSNVAGKNFTNFTINDVTSPITELLHDTTTHDIVSTDDSISLHQDTESNKELTVSERAVPTSADNTVIHFHQSDQSSFELPDTLLENDHDKSFDTSSSTITCDQTILENDDKNNNVTINEENTSEILNTTTTFDNTSLTTLPIGDTNNESMFGDNIKVKDKDDQNQQKIKDEILENEEVKHKNDLRVESEITFNFDHNIMEVDEINVVESGEVLIESSDNILEVDDQVEEVKSEIIESEVAIKEHIIEETVQDENFVEEVVIPCEEPELKPKKIQPKKNMFIDDDDEDELFEDVMENSAQEASEKIKEASRVEISSSTTKIVEGNEAKMVFNKTLSNKTEFIKDTSNLPSLIESTKPLHIEKKLKIQKEETVKEDCKNASKLKKDKKKKIKVESTKQKHDKLSSSSGKLKNKDKLHKKEKGKDEGKTDKNTGKLLGSSSNSHQKKKRDMPKLEEVSPLENKTEEPSLTAKKIVHQGDGTKAHQKNTNTEVKIGRNIEHKSNTGSSNKLKKKKRKHESDTDTNLGASGKSKDASASKYTDESIHKHTDVKTSFTKHINEKSSMKIKKEKSKMISNKHEISKREKSIKKESNKDSKAMKGVRPSKMTKHSTSLKVESNKIMDVHQALKSTQSLPEPDSKKQRLSSPAIKEHKKVKKSITNVADKKSKYALIYSDSDYSGEESITEMVKENNQGKAKTKWSDYEEMENKDNEMKKKAVYLSASSSSSNSSEFNDGPPPVPPSSMIVTETIKNETILPPEFNQSQFMQRLKETSPEHGKPSFSKSQKAAVVQDSPKKQKDMAKTKFMPSSSSEFSDSDESDSYSKQIPLKKVDDKLKRKQNLKSSLFSASGSSSDCSDSDDLSEIPLKSSSKKTSVSKAINKHLPVKKTKQSLDCGNTQKLLSKSSLNSSSKLPKINSDMKEKPRPKEKHTQIGKTLGEKSGAPDGKIALTDKKKKHKHSRKEGVSKKDGKIVEGSSKSEHGSYSPKIRIGNTANNTKTDSKIGPSTSSYEHTEKSIKEEMHVMKHKERDRRPHVRPKHTPNPMEQPSSCGEKSKKTSTHSHSLKSAKNENKKMVKKKHQNPFLQHLKDPKSESKPNNTHAAASSSKSSKPKSLFSSGSDEEKEVFKKKASKPFEGWKNFESMSKWKADTETTQKPSKTLPRSTSENIKKSHEIKLQSLPEKVHAELEVKTDSISKDSQSFYVQEPGNLNIVESPEQEVCLESDKTGQQDSIDHFASRSTPHIKEKTTANTKESFVHDNLEIHSKEEIGSVPKDRIASHHSKEKITSHSNERNASQSKEKIASHSKERTASHSKVRPASHSKEKITSHTKEKNSNHPKEKIQSHKQRNHPKKEKSKNRTQDEEAVLSIVSLNEDFQSSSSELPSEKYYPGVKKEEMPPQSEEEPILDSAADRELAAAVSSIEFDFGDFQRTKTPTAEEYPVISYEPPVVQKPIEQKDLKPTSENLTVDDESKMSQEEMDSSEAAVAANALLKVSADEDSSFELEASKTSTSKIGDCSIIKEKSLTLSQANDAVLLPSMVKPSYVIPTENNNVQKASTESAVLQSDTPSRKRRRPSRDEHNPTSKMHGSDNSSKQLEMDPEPQHAKLPRVEVMSTTHHMIVSKQETVPHLPQSPVLSAPTTWSPFIQSKYSPTLTSHALKQPAAPKKPFGEHDVTEVVRRSSNDQDQSGFVHPKIPSIPRRKSSSSSPAMSPNAGRGLPVATFSYDQAAEKTVKQMSPSLVSSNSNISPQHNMIPQRYDFSNPGLTSSSPQQYSSQIPFLAKPANFSPKGPTAQPPPTTVSPVYHIPKASPTSTMPVSSFPLSIQSQLSPRISMAQKFTSPPHVVPSQVYPFQAGSMPHHGPVYSSVHPRLHSPTIKTTVAERSVTTTPISLPRAPTSVHSVVTPQPSQPIQRYAFNPHSNVPQHHAKAPIHPMPQSFQGGMQYVSHSNPAAAVEKSPNAQAQDPHAAVTQAHIISPLRSSMAQSPASQAHHPNQSPIRSPHQSKSLTQQHQDKLPPQIQYSFSTTMLPHGTALHSPRQQHHLNLPQPSIDLLHVYQNHPNFQQQVQQQQVLAAASPRGISSPMHRPPHNPNISGPMYTTQPGVLAHPNTPSKSQPPNLHQNQGAMHNNATIKPTHAQRPPTPHRIITDSSKLTTSQTVLVSTAPQIAVSTKPSTNTPQITAANTQYPTHATFDFSYPGHENMLQHYSQTARHTLQQSMLPYLSNPFPHALNPAFRLPQNLALHPTSLIPGNPPITTESQNIPTPASTANAEREKMATPSTPNPHSNQPVKNQPQQYPTERIVNQPSGVVDLVSQHFRASLKDIPSTQGLQPHPQATQQHPETPKFHQQQVAQNAYKTVSPHQPSYIHPQQLAPPTNVGQPYYHPQWSARQQVPLHQPPAPQKQTLYVPPPETHDNVKKESQPPKTSAAEPPLKQEPGESGVMGLFQRYPVIWQGMLMLKNDSAKVQTHYICGNRQLGEIVLPKAHENGEDNLATLKINQRMRLEPSQLEGVSSRLNGTTSEFCLLLALPCGSNQTDVTTQQNLLRHSFVEYLQQKQAAGIVNTNLADNHPGAYVVQIFPPCEFTDQSLRNRAQDFLSNINDIQHLMIVISPAQ